MSRYFSYINSSKKILDGYDGSQPFHLYLKKQFSANKNFGSRDRKTISAICYAWLRTSHLFSRSLQDNNLLQAIFLCSREDNPVLEALAPELNARITSTEIEKLQQLQFNPSQIFPFEKQLGAIDPAAFSTSFLIQPLLFIRTRPGKKDKVAARLAEQGIAHQLVGGDCIALPNTTNLEEVLLLNKDAVIQDKNSQRVFDQVNPEWLPAGKVAVWDCCAASGGKSILLYDKLAGKLNLTVSDIRPNILYNCKKRLAEAGININNAFVADVAAPLSPDEAQAYDIIICDAPCSGSGTWSRTPEQLAGFSKDRIAAFSALQKSIAKNTSTQLKSGGLFIYITCSVFKEENESVVAAIDEQTELAVLQQEYLSGYEQQADTMFVAIFKKL